MFFSRPKSCPAPQGIAENLQVGVQMYRARLHCVRLAYHYLRENVCSSSQEANHFQRATSEEKQVVKSETAAAGRE